MLHDREKGWSTDVKTQHTGSRSMMLPNQLCAYALMDTNGNKETTDAQWQERSPLLTYLMLYYFRALLCMTSFLAYKRNSLRCFLSQKFGMMMSSQIHEFKNCPKKPIIEIFRYRDHLGCTSLFDISSNHKLARALNSCFPLRPHANDIILLHFSAGLEALASGFT